MEAEIYYLAHQNDRADQILAMFEDPAKHSILVHDMLGKTALARSAYHDAIHEFLTTSREEPDEPASWALLAYAYAQGGQRREALEAFAKLNQLSRRRYVAPYWMAVAWIGLGDRDKAMNSLNEAYRIRSSHLATIQRDPLLDPLRSDPRFQELLHKVGFPAGPANRSASE